MGFFSSIGDAISGVVGGVKDFISDTGSVVGDVASGVMGLAGNKSTNSANKAMNQAQLQLAREQFEWQKELAKNQIAWRVEDAQKAGLHPMAALGLQSTSFSPVSSSFTPMQAPDYSFLSDMGQSASYAAMKAKDRKEQAEALQLAQRQIALQVENMELQNDGLRTENEYRHWQLMTAMQGGANQGLNSPASVRVRPDGALIEGQGDSPIKVNLSETEANSPGKPAVAAASVPEISFARNADGGYSMVRSKDVADRLDDDVLGTISWYLRNYGSAYFDNQDFAPPKSWLPKGATHWVFNSGNMSWYPNNHRRGYNANIFSKLPLGYN